MGIIFKNKNYNEAILTNQTSFARFLV